MWSSRLRFAELRQRIIDRQRRKPGWFNRFMLWMNYVCIVLLLSAYSSRFISPIAFWPLAFCGLAYPVILVLNCAFVLYWFAQLRWFGFLSLAAVLGGLTYLSSVFQVNFSDETIEKTDVKVMTYNCMLFDLYNWNDNHNSRNKIFGMLLEESPDILCIQEFYTSENPLSFNNKDTLTKFLPSVNIHEEYTTTLRNVDHWGIATLSRYPIVRRGKIIFHEKTNNICIYSDLVIAVDTVRVYNMHLQSIQFKKSDYEFVSEVANNPTVEKGWVDNSEQIARRLKNAFQKRAFQSEMIAWHIKSCPYKVIVCGDFNDTPVSFAYYKIRADLKDAFVERGVGFEKTYNGKMPAFRIDYILHSKEFQTIEYRRIRESLTDHYPVTARIRLRDR